MTREPSLVGLLSEFRTSLEDFATQPKSTQFDVFAALVGTLSAAADVDTIRDATSSVQRRLKRTQDVLQHRELQMAREVLRAASTVKAGRVAAKAQEDNASSVRDRVLAQLKNGAELRTSDIANELELGLPQVSRALRELADRGLADRKDSPGLDGRARYWRLAPSEIRGSALFAVLASAIGNSEIDTGQFRNDMLPLGPSDRVDSNAVRAMATELANAVVSGAYRPVPAEFFRVAKDADTTRPAALLRLPDRIIYTSLVSTIAPALSEGLSDSVIWPRATFDAARWDEFEAWPLDRDASHVVVADIASFYDTIDHETVGDAMRERGASPDSVAALYSFLGTVMQRDVGLPQGLPASDLLASTSLARVDAALERADVLFRRHGDDYRFPVRDRYEARNAIAILDEALRASRFHLNTVKTHVVEIEDYSQNLSEREEHQAETLRAIRRVMGFETGEGLVGEREGFDPELDPGVDRFGRLAGIEQAQVFRDVIAPNFDSGERFQLGRYGEIEDFWLEEPDVEEHDKYEAFEDLIRLADGAAIAAGDRLRQRGHNRWERISDRRMFSSMLSVLSVVARPVGDVSWWVRHLEARPQDTRTAAVYLAHLAKNDEDELPAGIVEAGLREPFSDWQRAWLLSALAWSGTHHIERLRKQLYAHLDDSGWLTRVGAATLLQRAGLLSSSQLARLWTSAPMALRADLVVMLARSEPSEEIVRLLNDDADEVERCLVKM